MTDLEFFDAQYLAQVTERLAAVRERIEKAGGDVDGITIVAVTKTFEIKACLAALTLGLCDLGENFSAELIAKAQMICSIPQEQLPMMPTWHFLGGIQRNKLRALSPYVGVYEGVDRKEEAVAIARRAPGATVYIEVRVDESETKGGVVPNDVGALVERCASLGLCVGGLMTIAPEGDLERARHSFRTVRSLVDRFGLKDASMGMTDDLEVAVAEGATHIRIGRALFGTRQAK